MPYEKAMSNISILFLYTPYTDNNNIVLAEIKFRAKSLSQMEGPMTILIKLKKMAIIRKIIVINKNTLSSFLNKEALKFFLDFCIY